MNCLYCGNPTKNTLELGRGCRVIEIPCCESCFEEIDKRPQFRKDQMCGYAAIPIYDHVGIEEGTIFIPWSKENYLKSIKKIKDWGGDARTPQH